MSGGFTVAVVGAGYFGQYHYDAWRRIPEAALSALADRDPARGRATAERFGIARRYEDLATLLDDCKPDVIDIATPPESHRALVEAAAGRVRLIICQKPLAPSLAEAEALVALAEAAGTTLVAHENFRFQPWYREARALIEAGRLGALHGIAFRLRPGDGQGPDAYLGRQPYFQKMPRFLIHETGVHFVDTFRFLMGEVAAVTARLRRLNPAIAGEDAGQVIFEFASGAAGLFDGNRLNDHDAENCRLTMGEMHLEGSEGVLRLDGRGRLFLKPHGRSEAEVHYGWEAEGFAGDSVHALCRHVTDHLTHGTALENEGRAYLRNVEIVEAIYRSHETGVRVEV